MFDDLMTALWLIAATLLSAGALFISMSLRKRRYDTMKSSLLFVGLGSAAVGLILLVMCAAIHPPW